MANSLKRELMSEVFKEGKYTDFTVRCHGLELKVHRIVLSTSSKVLASMVDSCLSRDLLIMEFTDEASTFRRMINFLYNCTYDDADGEDAVSTPPRPIKKLKLETPKSEPGHPSSPDPGQSLVVHSKAYIIGCKYDLPKLRAHATTMFKQEAENNWGTRFFLEAIDNVFGNPEVRRNHKNMKKAVVSIASKNIKTLLHSLQFRVMIQKRSELGLRLLDSGYLAVYMDGTYVESARNQLKAEESDPE